MGALLREYLNTSTWPYQTALCKGVQFSLSLI